MSPVYPNHDQLFKELLHSFFPEFLLLVAPRNAQHLKLEHGKFLDTATFTDFPRGDHRQLDVVYRTRTLDDTPETVLVHVEVETEYRRSFDERMAHYGLSLFLRSRHPILPIALLLKGGSSGGELEPEVGIGWKTVQMAVPGSWINRFRYLAFSLSAASAEEYLKHKDPLAAALAALMPYRSGGPARHKLECMRQIAGAQELNAARTFQLANVVENYLQLEATEETEYRKSVLLQDDKEVSNMQLLFDRMLDERHTQGLAEGQGLGLKQGLKKGRELGLKKGREQGLIEGTRQTLLRQLQLRFGELPPALVEQIEACTDIDVLQQWSEAVISAPDLDAMGLGG